MQSGHSAADIIRILKNGGIGVIPTDTIYGIVGSTLNTRTVQRIYRLRKRDPQKPMVILIASPGDLARFGVDPDAAAKKVLRRVWPGRVSVVLPINGLVMRGAGGRQEYFIKKFRYLHRGTNTLAYRLPKPLWLRRLLAATGPLVAPSANVEGAPPARTITAAKKYFGAEGKKVSLYVDAGRIAARPSRLIKIEGGKLTIFRK